MNADEEFVHVTPHNCVCKLRVTQPLDGSRVAAILQGFYTTESHASPSSVRVLGGDIKASLRMFSQLKINIAGVHNYEGTCVMVWLVMLRLSLQLRMSCFPIETQWTNIQATGYLKFTVDLTRLHQDPACSTAVYDSLISCFRMYLVPNKKIHLSLYPNGSLVITGAPSVAVAEECLNKWMPIIRKYKLKDIDPDLEKKLRLEKLAKAKPTQRRRKRVLSTTFADDIRPINHK